MVTESALKASMKDGDRIILVLVEGHETTLKKWPLHITIIPWFASELSANDLKQILSSKLKGTKPFQVEVGKEAMFGEKHDIPVNVIKLPNPLEDIDKKLRSLIESKSSGIAYSNLRKRYGFNPHITFQGERRKYPGDKIRINKIQVVRIDNGLKRVESEVELNG